MEYNKKTLNKWKRELGFLDFRKEDLVDRSVENLERNKELLEMLKNIGGKDFDKQSFFKKYSKKGIN